MPFSLHILKSHQNSWQQISTRFHLRVLTLLFQQLANVECGLGTSLVVQWLRLRAPSVGGARAATRDPACSKLKTLHAPTKTQSSQIFKKIKRGLRSSTSLFYKSAR